MSTKPPSRSTPEPPNLRSDLADRSDVKALLTELQDGLKEGEDPLFYKLRRAAPDPACVGADAARIYVGPREVAGVVRPVVETAKVRVRSGVEERRAVAEPGVLRRGRGAWSLAVALALVGGGVVVMVLRSAGERGQEATEREATASVSSVSSVSVSASAAAVQSARAPLPVASASASASVSAMPVVSAAPMPALSTSATAAPMPAPSASATVAPTRKAGRRGVEDPYDAAPSPAPGVPRPALAADESKPEIPSPTPPQGAPRF
jgi:hypothetical protein